MENEYSLICDTDGVRLDAFIADGIDSITRSAAVKLIEQGDVTVDGVSRSKNYRLAVGQAVKVNVPPPVALEAVPQEMSLDIVYEDEHLLVVNKPQGIVVHPAAGNPDGTLVNGLLAHCGDSLSGINGVIRPGIVHRIDKDTSGLLIVAKNDEAHKGLAEQIKVHSFKRQYLAVLCGNVKEDNFTVDKPIARSKKDRKKMAVDPSGRNAVTHFEVEERFDRYTLVRCTLETGRTHQIRVHSAYIHHPIAGDPVYGKADKRLAGQCLHATLIGFNHPISGEYMEFCTPPPEWFNEFLNSI